MIKLRVGLLLPCLILGACGGNLTLPPLGDSRSGQTSSSAEKNRQTQASAPNKRKQSGSDRAPFGSSYEAPPSLPTLISNVNVLTGTGEQLQGVSVLLQSGKIVSIDDAELPEGGVIVEGNGRWLTPGIIDVHSHLGVYPEPAIPSHNDGNEIVSPNTAKVWAEHSVWPQDPAFEKALAGGVTTLQILPGSANLFGGRGVTLKNVSSITMQGMKFPNAPHSLKMACGENPKRVYGDKGGPATRMGNMAGYREAWIAASAYRDKWAAYKKKGKSADAPDRDLMLETLAGVLDGEIKVHNHCYRADEMVNMIDLAREFNYKVTAFHHAVEAYKVAPILAENDVCAVVWADWWGFKQEAADMIRENAALVHAVGGCAIIHSDDGIQTQRLLQEVAKVMQAAQVMGYKIRGADAIKWVTSNAAKSLGLENEVGSIEAGKNADVVLWSGNPFSVYTRADMVWIDGVLQYDKQQPGLRATADFNLGILKPAEDRP
ncbi:MAG: amidohydrolase [Gammaproteobacteria bacterium]|nr:amidohydrolase [Gammaproteobacteria bacterium]